jgi:hypothetical protein
MSNSTFDIRERSLASASMVTANVDAQLQTHMSEGGFAA